MIDYTFVLAPQRDCIALKAEVDKLDIDKLAKFQSGCNNLNTKLKD